MYKSLFIDLDDTLWDTYHNNKECLEEIYTDYHLDRYYASFEAFYGIYMPHNLDLWAKYRRGEIDRPTLILDRFLYVLRPLGITRKEEVLAINDDFLRRTTTKTRLIPGAIVLTIVWILRAILGINLNEVISFVFSPLVMGLNTLPGMMLYSLIVCLLWVCGIHGDNVLSGIASPIFLGLLAENVAAMPPEMFTSISEISARSTGRVSSGQ